MVEQLSVPLKKPWWRRWWAIVLWGVLALIIIGAIANIAGGGDVGNTAPQAPPVQQAPNQRVALFADASDGIEQFIGGDTMPVGTYEFKCGFLGNVSVQLGTAPYTGSLKEGDQTRRINRGDLVTVTFCKVYGPQ